MPITPDRISRLREFGLSEYAARAYLALLDLGLTEARDVSNLSRVPQAKVYQVLDQLHDKGLAIILPEFPKKYAPVPFEEFLARIHRQHLDAAQTIEKTRKELTTLFSVTGNVDVGDRGDFTVVRGRRNVIEKLVELCARAEHDLLVIGTPGLATRPQFLLDRTSDAHGRGVPVRFLLPLSRENIAPLERLSARSPVRARDEVAGDASGNVAIVIADGRAALLIHFVPDDGDLTNGRDVAVYTDQEAMVGAIQAMTGPLWDHAPTYVAQREQFETGREPLFTQFYASPDEATAALARAVERGVHDYRVVNPDTSGIPVAHMLETVPTVLDAGGHVRAILERTDGASLGRYRTLMAKVTGVQVRHADPAVTTPFWILDDREALLAVSRAEHDGAKEGETLFLHTNNPAVVQALASQFEAHWGRAMPYEERLREAERFPDLHPREVGIGRLFEALREPVLLFAADGRVRAVNAATQQLLGATPRELCGQPIQSLFPTLPEGEAAEFFTGSSTDRLLTAALVTKAGDEVAVEVSLSEIGSGTTALRAAVVRAVTPAGAREPRPVRVRAEASAPARSSDR